MPAKAKATPTDAETAVAVLDQSESQFMERFGDLITGLPTEISSLVQLSQQYSRQTADAIFEHGRVLIALKHQLPHGGFMEHVQDLGIDHSWANKAMKFAADCAELKTVTNGRLDFQAVAKLGQSKARLFVRAALESPDEADESQIDKYSALSVRELERQLRDRDAKDERGKEQLLAAKEENEKLRAQMAQLREASPDNVNSRCFEFLHELSEATNLFLRKLPRDQKIGPDHVRLLLQVKAEALTAATQVAHLIDQLYPEIHQAEDLMAGKSAAEALFGALGAPGSRALGDPHADDGDNGNGAEVRDIAPATDSRKSRGTKTKK
jgi:hypothetical protein